MLIPDVPAWKKWAFWLLLVSFVALVIAVACQFRRVPKPEPAGRRTGGIALTVDAREL